MSKGGLTIAAYVRSNESRTNERVTHFGEGLGARFSTREAPITCDLAIQAGFQISPAMADAMDRGIPIIILENPVWHYGDKPSTYTWGYNGLGALSTGGILGSEEARPHPPLQPWKDPEEGVITIFGQVPNDKALRGADIHEWVRSMEQVFGPHAEVRDHPVVLNAQEMADQEAFTDCLARTSTAVTYSSTVGAQAVIQGIPTYAAHAGSWAYPVSARPSEPICTPSRNGWIRELSYRHWSTSERLNVSHILSGYGQARARAERGEYDNMSNGRAQ
jgi:hypothetical protein